MPRMMSPNTTVWWVTDPTFDPAAPSVALLTAGLNASCAIESGYKLGMTSSDTDSSTSICDSATVQNATAINYEGDLTFFREGDLADTTSAFAKAFEEFKDGIQGGNVEGYLVRRLGYLNTVAPAVGQFVDSFKFIPDNPKDVVEDNGPIKFSVKFHQQGTVGLNKALVA